MDSSWLDYSEKTLLGSILLGAHPKSTHANKEGRVVKPKGYIYCFDIIPLLQCVQEKRVRSNNSLI